MKDKEALALFRLKYIEKINNRPKGIKIADACNKLGISFPTYYKWKRRLLEADKDDNMTALFDRRPSGERHYKSLTKEQEDAIIGIIITYPKYGSQRISSALKKNEDEKSLVSNGGVQKFLERRGLNFIKNRIKFAEDCFKAMKGLSKKDNDFFPNRKQEEEVVLSGVVNL